MAFQRVVKAIFTINPKDASKIMRMLENNLFFDTLNVFLIKVRMNDFDSKPYA